MSQLRLMLWNHDKAEFDTARQRAMAFVEVVWGCVDWSELVGRKESGTLSWCTTAFMWVNHMTISRCCSWMAELDMTAAIATISKGLHLFQRDLILGSVRAELVQGA